MMCTSLKSFAFQMVFIHLELISMYNVIQRSNLIFYPYVYPVMSAQFTEKFILRLSAVLPLSNVKFQGVCESVSGFSVMVH